MDCILGYFSARQPHIQRRPLSQTSDHAWSSPNSLEEDHVTTRIPIACLWAYQCREEQCNLHTVPVTAPPLQSICHLMT
jgi:hypothetical protein